MESPLLDNESREYLKKQLAIFRPPAPTDDNETDLTADTVIASRVRPLLPDEKLVGHVAGILTRDGNTQHVETHELRRKIRGNQLAITSSSFKVDKSYGPDSSSDTIYHDLVAPLVSWAWAGGVGTLFAYGQTGSGKTYTVSVLEKLAAIEIMSGSLKGKREVYVCAFEIAGKTAFDLLNDRRRIAVLEDSFGETQLVGIVEHNPSSAEELIQLIDRSMSFRRSAPTLKNDSSSRSHAVCRIRIANKEVDEALDGLLFLVDLAGSESAADIKDHSQERMKETREINTSLSTLKDCIRGRAMWNVMDHTGTSSTARAKHVHVPYRSSILTKVLKHVFDIKGERACKTAVVACVSPSLLDVGPGKNTLRYAEMLRVQVPKTKPTGYNEDTPSTWSHKETQEWIEKNSGEPPVSAAFLAPNENGIQLCRLSKSEFISRCQLTPGITSEQAQAFYNKLWRLHIDSRTKDTTAEETVEKPKESFSNRLKSGMFVRTSPSNPGDALTMVMIMSPEGSFDKMRTQKLHTRGYICAELQPSAMADAYILDVAKQRVVSVADMEAEVLVEFDSATRFYYITL